MEQLGKALGLIKLLNEKGKIDSSIVAEEFGVSIRTAQRYLVEATRILPIQADEIGKNKLEYSLMEHYSFKESLMDKTELNILAGLIDYAKSILGNKQYSYLEVIKKKLFYANNSCPPFHFIDDNSIDFKKIAKTNEKLNEYINKKYIIEFKYKNIKKTYKVEPYKILYWSGYWYLLAKHDNIIKKFLLDYIKNIKQTKYCYLELPFDLINQLNDSTNIWFNSDKKEIVTVEISKVVASYFKRKIILSKQKIIKENKKGDITIEFEVANERDLFHQIIVWLPHFKIIKPTKYSSFLTKELKKALSKNL